MDRNNYHQKLTNYLDKLITEEELHRIKGFEATEIVYADKDEKILFEKLKDDKCVKEIDGKYLVTVDGRLFAESGGYVEKIRQQTISVNLQSVQTWAIAVGTSLAGLYAFFQLLELLCKCFSCHH